MKKIISLVCAVIFMFSLSACGISLTESQKNCCSEADEHFNSLAEDMDIKFDSKMDKKDGKILYVATLDFADRLTDGLDDDIANAFGQYTMPYAEKIFEGEDIYVVLYLNEKGHEVYRLIDSKLNSDFLD